MSQLIMPSFSDIISKCYDLSKGAGFHVKGFGEDHDLQLKIKKDAEENINIKTVMEGKEVDDATDITIDCLYSELHRINSYKAFTFV